MCVKVPHLGLSRGKGENSPTRIELCCGGCFESRVGPGGFPGEILVRLSEREDHEMAVLHARLHELPESRDQQVRRAKELVADPNYPSRSVLQSVASVLAAAWK